MPRVKETLRAAPEFRFLVEVEVTLGGVNADWHGTRRACGDAVAGRRRLNVRHIRPVASARGTDGRFHSTRTLPYAAHFCEAIM